MPVTPAAVLPPASGAGRQIAPAEEALPDVEELELVLGDDSPTPIGQGLDGRSLEAIASGITRFMRDAGYEVE